MTTGERIKARRKQLSISADALAEKINVSRSTVFRWEKGEIEKIPAVELNSIAQALQTTAEYLIGWSDDPEGKTNNGQVHGKIQLKELSPKKQQLIDLLSQVPDEKADLLIHIVQSVLEDARK